MAKIALHTLWSLKTDFIGGTERFLVEFSKELTALGHEPYIVCSNLQPEMRIEGIRVIGRVPDDLKPLYVECGTNIAEFVRRGIFDKPAGSDAFRKISEYVHRQLSGLEADIVHLNAFSAAMHVDLECPKVVTNHENDLELDYFWHPGAFEEMAGIVRESETRLGHRSALFAPSLHYALEYSQRLGLNVKPIALGVCLDNFHVDHAQTKKQSHKTVLMPSRFYPKQKGQDVALEACRILKKESERDFLFVFSGVRDYYTPHVQAFLEKARELEVANCVRIKKYAQIQDGYREADIVISPERYCSYGLSISEALSLGIPTVLSSIPTYIEIASGYSHAFFFEVDDASGLASGILRALDLAKSDIKSEIARFRAANDIRDCAKQYSDEYAVLLGV